MVDTLANKFALFLLLIIPLLALLKSRTGRESAVQFSSLHILNRMGSKAKGRAGRLRISPLLLAITLAIIALARPQSVKKQEVITSDSGIELIIAIDVSRSMFAQDFEIGSEKVPRLHAAKKVTREFIQSRTSDRIGIVAFAARPYLASPLTLSKSWLEGPHGLGRVEIGVVEDGTAIGSAIAASAQRLDKSDAKSKVVVLLTDGKNRSGKLNPIEAAKLAKTLNIKIYTIAVGTYGDFYIPTPNGQQLISGEYDEDTLKKIAEISEGKFFRAQNTGTLQQVFTEIDKMEKSEVQRKVRVEANELFVWPALGALVAGIFALVSKETFHRRLP